MAANKPGENHELVENLRKDFDKHLKEVYEKNKDFKYEDGFTSENFEKEVKKIPAFINETPTQEEIDASPALSALQALKYEETDPYECALAHKEDGNHHFKEKDYGNAVTAYTEGLKQKFEDVDLRVILFTNRAVANFYLGNHRSSINDSFQALKLNDKHMKAILRVDPKEKRLTSLRQKAVTNQKLQERDKRKREVNEKKMQQKKMKLISALKERSITSEGSDQLDVFERIRLSAENQPQESKLYLDEHGQLHWPVYFLYPEFNQSDFVEDFCENNSFFDHINLMFDASCLPDWDVEKKYSKENLQVFYEDRQRNACVKIPSSKTLKDVLSDKRFVIRNGAPGFLVLSKASNFYNEFTKTVSIES